MKDYFDNQMGSAFLNNHGVFPTCHKSMCSATKYESSKSCLPEAIIKVDDLNTIQYLKLIIMNLPWSIASSLS